MTSQSAATVDGSAGAEARTASRTRVLAAARALFADRGFAACRVADIARAAGMSPGNVYWLYESKEAVLGAVLQDGYDQLGGMAAAVAAEYGPARRKLEILVTRTIEVFEANTEFTIIVAGLAGAGGRDQVAGLGIDVAAIEARCRADLRNVMAEARSEGAIGPADPELLADAWLALFRGLVISGRDRWAAMPRDAVRDLALRLIGYRPAGQVPGATSSTT
jgi:AcrR family transcriptional regulator